MPRYRYVVDEAAVTGLLGLSDAEIARLLPAIENLAEAPLGPADFTALINVAAGSRVESRAIF